MFGLETLTGPGQAVAIVGLVFGEAIVLYVGYGALNSVAGTAILDKLGGD